ncbi:hypothetical protein CC2G_011413 [Coprinopsis cinerea AmutBmut pab1-1]|nr:hypothetical protein CC2G_011413 [Coprinopsis cinerea AmutBmut pab1-1]
MASLRNPSSYYPLQSVFQQYSRNAAMIFEFTTPVDLHECKCGSSCSCNPYVNYCYYASLFIADRPPDALAVTPSLNLRPRAVVPAAAPAATASASPESASVKCTAFTVTK